MYKSFSYARQKKLKQSNPNTTAQTQISIANGYTISRKGGIRLTLERLEKLQKKNSVTNLLIGSYCDLVFKCSFVFIKADSNVQCFV